MIRSIQQDDGLGVVGHDDQRARQEVVRSSLQDVGRGADTVGYAARTRAARSSSRGTFSPDHAAGRYVDCDVSDSLRRRKAVSTPRPS